MNKRQYESAWKKLDKALDAIEQLSHSGFFNDDGFLFAEIASLKNEIEMEIKKRNNKSKEKEK